MSRKAYQQVHTKGYPKTLRTLNKIIKTSHVEENQMDNSLSRAMSDPKPLKRHEEAELRAKGLEIRGGYVIY